MPLNISSPRILLLGSLGQIGFRLSAALKVVGELISLDRSACDVANLDQLLATLNRTQPNIIVNATGYTAVDAAENNPDDAYAINTDPLAVIGLWAYQHNALVVHFSTDYVFDGTLSTPYQETDVANPINVYGQSKYAGEQILADTQATHIIMRTSWVYDNQGTNFLHTILRLAQQQNTLSVVADQYGAPTSARQIAQATANILQYLTKHPAAFTSGIYHFSASGSCSWHTFATSIIQHTHAYYGQRNLPCPLVVEQIIATSSSALSGAALRPVNSRLNSNKAMTAFALSTTPWHTEMPQVLEQILDKTLPLIC